MTFTPESLDFLFENRLQNSREWFGAHRAVYQERVVRPMRELFAALSPHMLTIDPEFMTDPIRAVSRVHRDVRRNRDGMLYRDEMWFLFVRLREEHDLPGFYFSLSPQGFWCGCGYYQAPAAVMACMREMILSGDPLFDEVLALYRTGRYQLEGEKFKRDRYPQADAERADFLNRRGISMSLESHDFSLLFSEGLADYLTERFDELVPFYRMMNRAERLAREAQIK